ncbi:MULTISPECIES: glycosyltransferase family 2 protein [Klebsiella]|jgi:glycosyltransferase involved in cell wall biosynthesis|uniref:glycosyltransferase family 2 protein n=2 Tax=Klebsiella/Raoultella group TaxID=2890311 RepID=UPI001C682EE9|nr:glycosyltransferase family A protein [Klebsiella sp. CVUAS 11332]MBW5980578.1 glycosyl transferase family 2 [Klebsiella michiganensis]MBW6033537.1 glycosyl transferase family 2 [Klebsiella sp. CVUAS 11332]
MDLSIVIPCYNCESNIVNIFNSLVLQNYPNIEVIFINDGSKDNTSNVIRESLKAHKLNNFFLYDFDNSGAAKARQRGLEKAIGEYVFFVDADDIISPNFLYKILNVIATKPDMVYFSSEIISSIPPFEKIANKLSFLNDKEYLDRNAFLNDMFTSGNWTTAVWTYVFRRELAIHSQAIFTQRSAHEDHLFTLRLVGAANRICVIKDVLYYQKRTAGSLTNSSKNLQYILERFRAFEEATFDMRKKFDTCSIQMYQIWSLHSFLFLCLENFKVVTIWFITPKAYSKLWKYRTDIAKILVTLFAKKIKRII